MVVFIEVTDQRRTNEERFGTQTKIEVLWTENRRYIEEDIGQEERRRIDEVRRWSIWRICEIWSEECGDLPKPVAKRC